MPAGRPRHAVAVAARRFPDLSPVQRGGASPARDVVTVGSVVRMDVEPRADSVPVARSDDLTGFDRPSARAINIHPLRAVMGLVPFRRFLGAQFLSALVNGTLRFALVWITLDLTDWDPAVGLVGLALGGAGLVVAVPAGAWSDRTDRRLLFVRVSAVTTVVLASAAVVVGLDLGGVWAVTVHAALLGALLTSVAPSTQAMVSVLVPPERLMNGVALQMISMNVAMMMGAVVGGAAIAIGGNVGGLALLATFEAIATVQMARVEVPARVVQTTKTRMRTDIGEGFRWARAHEPARSLLVIMLVLGFLWGGVTLLLPELAKDELGAGAFASSVLFAPLGLGMIITSMTLASRPTVRQRGRLLTMCFVFVAGPMVVLMGLSRSYVLDLALMALWGTGGGVVMTIQRTLLQEQTPDELMGRVMGLNTLGMLGSFPLAALTASILTGAIGTGGALVAMGAACTVTAMGLSIRRPIRTAA